MEVHDLPNRTRYVKQSALRLAGQIGIPLDLSHNRFAETQLPYC